MSENKEIEVKLKIKRKEIGPLIKLVKKYEAKDLGKFEQTDILLDYSQKGKTFGTLDQSLRIRIEKTKGESETIFTFKGTPEIDDLGKKTRDEFNVTVENHKSLLLILESIGFTEDMKIIKKRHKFILGGVKVVIDRLKFGCFVELEGEKEDIDRVVKKLKLESYPIEKSPYFKLQLNWEEKNR